MQPFTVEKNMTFQSKECSMECGLQCLPGVQRSDVLIKSCLAEMRKDVSEVTRTQAKDSQT